MNGTAASARTAFSSRYRASGWCSDRSCSAKRRRKHSRGKLIYGLLLINNVLAIGLGLSPSFWGGALVQVGRGFCVGFAITLWDTTVMQRVPQHMLSRVISMDWFGSLGLYPAGLGLWAILSGLGPPGTLIAAAAALCSLLFLLGLADPAIRDLD
jgi:hypothetical protein